MRSQQEVGVRMQIDEEKNREFLSLTLRQSIH